MKLEYRKLTQAEIDQAIAGLNGWRVDDEKLVKGFAFDSYRDGVDFAVEVSEEAEELDHHPDILIGYQKVTVSVSTHSVKGLSPYDFELAKRIDEI